MKRNKIIFSNLPLIYIKEIQRLKSQKYFKFADFKISSQYVNYDVFVKYDFSCANCGKRAAYCNLEYNHKYKYHFNTYTESGEMLTKDHIYPKSKGGLDTLKNYQLLCYSCNQKKKDNSPVKLITALREGYATTKSVECAIKNKKPNVLIGV